MTHLEKLAEEMKDTIFYVSLDYFMNYLVSSDDLEDILVDIYLSEIDVGNSNEGEIIAHAILEGVHDHQYQKIAIDKDINLYLSDMQHMIDEYYSSYEAIPLWKNIYQSFQVSSLDVGSIIDNDELTENTNQIPILALEWFKNYNFANKQYINIYKTLQQKIDLLKELNHCNETPEIIIYDYIPSKEALICMLSMVSYTFIKNHHLSKLTSETLARHLGILAYNEYNQFSLVRSLILDKNYLDHNIDSNDYFIATENDKNVLSTITIWELITIFGNNSEYFILYQPELFYGIICDFFLSLTQVMCN